MYIILEINIERYKKREIYIVLFLDETTLSVVSKFSFVFIHTNTSQVQNLV